jgi:hypothetical protein
MLKNENDICDNNSKFQRKNFSSEYISDNFKEVDRENDASRSVSGSVVAAVYSLESKDMKYFWT